MATIGDADIVRPDDDQLPKLGAAISKQRKAFKISTQAIAERAGISRVTLHRIERGEPSVSAGSYSRVMAVLNLALCAQQLRPAEGLRADREAPSAQGWIPVRVVLAEYPQLKALCWHLPGISELSPSEAHSIYWRNQRFLDASNLDEREAELIKNLNAVFDDGEAQ